MLAKGVGEVMCLVLAAMWLCAERNRQCKRTERRVSVCCMWFVISTEWHERNDLEGTYQNCIVYCTYYLVTAASVFVGIIYFDSVVKRGMPIPSPLRLLRA